LFYLRGITGAGIKMFKKIKEHLKETEWSYWKHLSHSIQQSNKLIGCAVKSYIHGIFPCWFKADGPITVAKMYHQINKIHHVHKMIQQMKKDGDI